MARRDDDDPTLQPELDNSTEGGSGEDEAAPESDSVTRRRFDPSSIGLSTTVTKDVTQIEALVDWGDYRAEPPLPEEVLAPDAQGERVRRDLAWCREPRQSRLAIPIKEGWSNRLLPESAAPQRRGGGLVLSVFCRPCAIKSAAEPDRQGWALSVFVINRRAATHRRYADLSYAFQVRSTLTWLVEGSAASADLSGIAGDDRDLRVNDLHYADVAFYASG